MSEEELKKEMDSVNTDVISQKMRNTMFTIVELENIEDSSCIFKQVFETFTEAEKTQLACTYIAKHMKDLIEKDPQFLNLIRCYKKMKEAEKSINK